MPQEPGEELSDQHLGHRLGLVRLGQRDPEPLGEAGADDVEQVLAHGQHHGLAAEAFPEQHAPDGLLRQRPLPDLPEHTFQSIGGGE